MCKELYKLGKVIYRLMVYFDKGGGGGEAILTVLF